MRKERATTMTTPLMAEYPELSHLRHADPVLDVADPR